MVWLAFYVPITFEPVCLSILKKYVCIDNVTTHILYCDSILRAYVHKDIQKVDNVEIDILIRRRSTLWIKKTIISKLARWADRLNRNAALNSNVKINSHPPWDISAMTKYILSTNDYIISRASYTWITPYDIRQIERYMVKTFISNPSDWIEYLLWLEYTVEYPIRFFKYMAKCVPVTCFNKDRLWTYEEFIRKRNVHRIILKTFLDDISDEDSD